MCVYIHTCTRTTKFSHWHHTIRRQEELHHPRSSRPQELRAPYCICICIYIHTYTCKHSLTHAPHHTCTTFTHTCTTSFTDNKNYTILDAPGDKNFVPHLVYVYIFTYIHTHTKLRSHIHHTVHRQEEPHHPRSSRRQEARAPHDTLICIYIHTYTHANVHSHVHHTIHRQKELHHPRCSRAQELRAPHDWRCVAGGCCVSRHLSA